MTMDTLRSDAARLLTEGKVKLVLGYASRGSKRRAVFITKPEQTSTLVYDSACRQNLAAYLAKPEVRGRFPVALVASPPPAAACWCWPANPSLRGRSLGPGRGRGSLPGRFRPSRPGSPSQDYHTPLPPEWGRETQSGVPLAWPVEGWPEQAGMGEDRWPNWKPCPPRSAPSSGRSTSPAAPAATPAARPARAATAGAASSRRTCRSGSPPPRQATATMPGTSSAPSTKPAAAPSAAPARPPARKTSRSCS